MEIPNIATNGANTGSKDKHCECSSGPWLKQKKKRFDSNTEFKWDRGQTNGAVGHRDDWGQFRHEQHGAVCEEKGTAALNIGNPDWSG